MVKPQEPPSEPPPPEPPPEGADSDPAACGSERALLESLCDVDTPKSNTEAVEDTEEMSEPQAGIVSISSTGDGARLPGDFLQSPVDWENNAIHPDLGSVASVQSVSSTHSNQRGRGATMASFAMSLKSKTSGVRKGMLQKARRGRSGID
jgi:hypothetical protein